MKTFTFLFLLFFVSQVYGHSNFQRGFVITNEQDTLSGWIDFRSDALNMSVCNFKTEYGGEITTFLPGSIFGYRFYDIGRFYVSREIEINDVPRLVFLEFVVQGMMNLFYFFDEETETQYYFFESQEGRMVAVPKRPDGVIETESGTQAVRRDLRYRGIVRYLFHEQEEMARQVNRIRFDHRSMIDIVQRYHDLTCPIGEDCIIFEASDENFWRFRFSVYGGAQFYSSRFFNRVTPVVGGKVNISDPRISHNLSFQAGLSIFQSVRTRELTPHTHLEISELFVPLSVGLKYTFGHRNRIRPTIEGGASAVFSFNRKYNFRRITNPEWQPAPIFERDFSTYPGLFGATGLEFMLNDRQAVFVNIGVSAVFERAKDPHFLPQLKVGFTF